MRFLIIACVALVAGGCWYAKTPEQEYAPPAPATPTTPDNNEVRLIALQSDLNALRKELDTLKAHQQEQGKQQTEQGNQITTLETGVKIGVWGCIVASASLALCLLGLVTGVISLKIQRLHEMLVFVGNYLTEKATDFFHQYG
jgi:hypothetical protein